MWLQGKRLVAKTPLAQGSQPFRVNLVMRIGSIEKWI